MRTLVLVLLVLIVAVGLVGCKGLMAALAIPTGENEPILVSPPDPTGWSTWDYIGYYLALLAQGAVGYLAIGRPARLGVGALIDKIKASKTTPT